MPLKMMKAGDKVRITAVTGDEQVRKHLGALAIIPGALATVVQSDGGNMILGIQESRIAVGPDVTSHVLVEAV